MYSHFVLRQGWVECLERSTCFRGVHSEYSPAVLNDFPSEWVETMFNMVISESTVSFYDEDEELHNVDGPAQEILVLMHGKEQYSSVWYSHGEYHRVDGPAVMSGDGRREWFVNGLRHREDGPAIEYPNGDHMWYTKNELHRVDGPAIDAATHQQWVQHGKIHRIDGPAIITQEGLNSWYVNGKLHREGGPAIVKVDGTEEWWVNGEQIFPQESASSEPTI